MNLSLGKIFKKEKEAAPAKQTVAPPIEKPASERLRKTVMPTASRETELPEPAPYRAPEPVAPLSGPETDFLKPGAARAVARRATPGATRAAADGETSVAPAARPVNFNARNGCARH